jgi:hypothetical protein
MSTEDISTSNLYPSSAMGRPFVSCPPGQHIKFNRQSVFAYNKTQNIAESLHPPLEKIKN